MRGFFLEPTPKVITQIDTRNRRACKAGVGYVRSVIVERAAQGRAARGTATRRPGMAGEEERSAYPTPALALSRIIDATQH